MKSLEINIKKKHGCVKLIYLMMDDKYNYKLTEEEMLYLTMHIQSITGEINIIKFITVIFGLLLKYELNIRSVQAKP